MPASMLIRRAAVGLALAASTLAPVASAVAQAPVHLVVVDVKVVALGYRVSQLIGRPVENQQGETVGKIDDLVIGQHRVLFTILSVGGFLGVGDHNVVAPYAALRMGPNRIVWPGATKAAVRALPEFHYR